MAQVKADGVVFLSEMTDDCRLVSDLLSGPVEGGDAIRSLITTLEGIYQSYEVLFEKSVGCRDIRICRAALINGDIVEITTIALRDDSGWVVELVIDHTPSDSAKSLAHYLLRKGSIDDAKRTFR